MSRTHRRNSTGRQIIDMNSETPQLALLTLELFIPASGSLKSKRSVLKSLKDRIRGRFNASVSEIAEQDKWQKAVLAAAIVGSGKKHVESELAGVLALAESVHDLEVLSHRIEFL